MESNTWERKEDLEHARELVNKFEGRMNAKVRRQKKIDMVEEKDFRRGGVAGKVYGKNVIWMG